MKKKKIVELTLKEAYLLWNIACWFQSPVTSTLKYKLAKAVDPDSPETHKFDKMYEKKIIARIREVGCWIKKYHPEWLEEK